MNERELFITALQRPDPAERAAVLEQACAGDPSLRRRVEVLLGAHVEVGAILEAPDPLDSESAQPRMSAPTERSVSASTPGRASDQSLTEEFGGNPDDETISFVLRPKFAEDHAWESTGLSQFDLLAELGRGGMGVVYKARHRFLNRIVALKMISDGRHASAEHRERFLIEAEAVARLRHPNIVQIYDFGESEGRPFVTLELLEGGSLADRLKCTTQPGRAAALIVATLASAMHAAHHAGILHRDLKPSNILFDRDDIPKIADFGLAKRLEVEEGHTLTGQIMGTPRYMAPEQAEGLTHAIGAPADIYALGAILYEMLTGRPPFMGASVPETLRQVVFDDVVPPSRLQPQIARDLETICLKCLQKEPQKRYSTALELADDLRRYGEDRPIRARRTPLLERVAKWVRRHPTTTTLIGLGAAAVVLLVAAGLRYDAGRKLAARIDAEQVGRLAARSDLELFKAQAKVAEKAWPEAKDILTSLQKDLEHERRLGALRDRAAGMLVQVQRGIEAEKLQEMDRQRCDRFLQLRDEAFIHQTGFPGLDLPTNPDETRTAAREALRVFASAPQGDQWNLSALPSTLSPKARSEIVEGSYELLLVLADSVAQPMPGEDPKQQAEQGLKILDQAARVRPESTYAYHLQRAACLARQGDAAGVDRETALAERLPPTTAADHFVAGRVRFSRRAWNAAAADFDAVLQLQPEHFWAQCLSAICALQTNRPAEAKVGLNVCLQRKPGFVWLYLLRAFASGQIAALALETAKVLPAEAGDLKAGAENQFAAAEIDYRTALEMLDRKPNDDLRYTLLVNRGVMRYRGLRLEEAVEDLQEAIRLNDRQYEAIATLARVYQQQKKWDEAVEQFTRAIRLKTRFSPLFRGRAGVQQDRDDPTPQQRAEALRDLDEAIAHEAPGNSILASDQTRRGDLLRRLHRDEEALTACDAALKVLPGYSEAHRLRVLVLVDLKRYDEVIRSCDGALAEGKPWADLHEIRGLARAGRKEFAGAIADYTLALEQRPGQSRILILRGLTYLVTDAPTLAIGDFEEALRLDPTSDEAHSGRGAALARLGDPRGAVVEAEESLRHKPLNSRRAYVAARIYAQAALGVSSEVRRTGRDAVNLVSRYQDRAVDLASQALQLLPAGQRAEFWRTQIQTDPALQSLSSRLKFPEMVAPTTTTKE